LFQLRGVSRGRIPRYFPFFFCAGCVVTLDTVVGGVGGGGGGGGEQET